MEDYQKSIEELKKELPSRLGRRIDSIILYGSAARGEYRPMKSDIDILVIGGGDKGLKGEVSRIIGDIDLNNSTATTLVYLTSNVFKQYLKWGSPFLEAVVEEGMVLYDRGTFEQVLRSHVKAGR